MTSNATHVEQELLALPLEERAAVLERGLSSLDDATSESSYGVDHAWATEIAKRLDSYEAGTAQLVDTDLHHAQLRASLTSRLA